MQQLQKQSTASFPSSSPNLNAIPTMQPQQRAGRNQRRSYVIKQAHKTLKGQCVLLALSIFVLSVIGAFSISGVFRQALTDLDTIVKASAPSVDAAQAMSQYLQDIDARAADYLAAAGLPEKIPCSVPEATSAPVLRTVHDCDDLVISAEIVLFNKELYLAAHNVTYPGERTALERITAGFEEYVGDVSVMRHEYELAAHKTDPGDEHLQKAHQAYLAANNVLLKRITQQPATDVQGRPLYDEPFLPDCVIKDPLGDQRVAATTWPLGGIQENIDCFNSINKTFLDQAYDDSINFLGSGLIVVTVFCAVEMLLIAFATGRMLLVTHRIINPGLTLALVVSIIFSIVVMSRIVELSGRHGTFGQLVKDDYDSVYYAAQLHHYATAANADESRWLIAVQFNDQVELDHWYHDWLDNNGRVKQLVDRAVANRTWPEEDRPLAEMQVHWQTYVAFDAQIRSKTNVTTNPDRINDAERLSTGQSNQTFSRFIDAVTRLSTANHAHFERSYADEAAALTLATILSMVLLPIIGLLAVWGIALRLKDF